MEKRLKRIEIILIIISTFLVINIATTIFVNQPKAIADIVKQENLKDLPKDLTRDFNDQTIYKIKTEFNRANWDEIHTIFGDYAKVQIDLEDVETEFQKLRLLTGSIETYSYSHYIFEGEVEGADWFEIYYKCRFDKGKGTITISTRTVDEVSEICGINIVLDGL